MGKTKKNGKFYLATGVIGPGIGAWILRNAESIVNNDGTTSAIPNEKFFWAR